jgi:hypothetical protein
MATGSQTHTLEELLSQLTKAGRDHEAVSVRELRDTIGRRSFAPVLLAASLIAFTPLGLIPGMPTALAVVIMLVAAQIVLGYDSIWLPKKILEHRITRGKLEAGAKKLRSVARIIDKVIRPRLTFLTEQPYSYLIAIICLLLALTLPPLELLPIVDIPLWAAIVAFSLALVAHDGLLAIVAFLLTATGVGLVVRALL